MSNHLRAVLLDLLGGALVGIAAGVCLSVIFALLTCYATASCRTEKQPPTPPHEVRVMMVRFPTW